MWLLAGFMATTSFISMWMSNVATTAMMVPIAQAVLEQLRDTRKNDSNGNIVKSTPNGQQGINFNYANFFSLRIFGQLFSETAFFSWIGSQFFSESPFWLDKLFLYDLKVWLDKWIAWLKKSCPLIPPQV